MTRPPTLPSWISPRTRRTWTFRRSAAEQLPRSLADVDLAVINGNYALQADLNAAEDSLITENPDYAKVYVNVVACRSGEENSDKIQALKKALQSDDVKKYVDETYKVQS